MFELSRAILAELPDAIRKKESEFNFANVSDMMFLYAAGDMTQDKQFFYYLEK